MTTTCSTLQSESAAPERDSPIDFLRQVWGDTPGNVWIPTNDPRAKRWSEGPALQWPTDSERIAERVVTATGSGLDCYYSTNVLASPTRVVGTSVAPRVLHADLDRDPTPEDAQKIELLDALTVCSGTGGHLHVYVFLDAPVPVETYHPMQHRLVAFLGADAKVRDNDVLRIPGTANHKHDPPTEVFVDRESGSVWSVAELDEMLPPLAVSEAPQTETAEIESEPVETVPRAVADALEGRAGNRSETIWAVMRESARSGLTKGQCKRVLLDDDEIRARGFGDTEIHKAYRVTEPELIDIADLIGPTSPAATTPPGGSSAPDETGWTFSDLSAAADEGDPGPLPVMLLRDGDDESGLIYPGLRHSIFGKPGSGKSWVALILTVEQARAGHEVLYLDYESNARSMRSRLAQLGVDAATRSRIHYVQAPSSPIPQRLYRNGAEPWRLIVIDGFVPFLQTYGVANDSNDDVARIMHGVLKQLADTGAAVVDIDHIPKNSPPNTSGPIGAMSKHGQHEVCIRAEGDPRTPVRRRAVGHVDLYCTKDRPGWVESSGDGGSGPRVAVVEIDATEPIYRTRVLGSQSLSDLIGENRSLAEVLASLSDDPASLTNQQAQDLLRSNGHRAGNDKIGEALRYLRAERADQLPT